MKKILLWAFAAWGLIDVLVLGGWWLISMQGKMGPTLVIQYGDPADFGRLEIETGVTAERITEANALMDSFPGLSVYVCPREGGTCMRQ